MAEITNYILVGALILFVLIWKIRLSMEGSKLQERQIKATRDIINKLESDDVSDEEKNAIREHWKNLNFGYNYGKTNKGILK